MSNNNRTLIPAARYGLDRFKMEVASNIGLTNYDQIDKGNLTSRENGRVGGEMVRRMVESYEKGLTGR